MPAKNVEEIKAESHSLRGKIAETLQQNEIIPGAVHFGKREHRSRHDYVVMTNSK
jgi:hypothetical protein